MIVFITSAYFKRFVDIICLDNPRATPGNYEVLRYPNGEMHVHIGDNVINEECLIIGSISPPDENLMALLMASEALKRQGARSVQVFLPYLSYSRQDKLLPGEGGGIELVGSLLRASGIDKIITVDAHSQLDEKLIGLPLLSISSASLFVPSVQSLGWGDFTVVAPDKGATHRAQAVANLLGITKPIAHLSKKHEAGNIVHFDLIGDVGERVVVVDDIIDSGHTIISACDMLRKNGVKDIVVIISHGLFINDAIKKISKLNLTALFVSDSIPGVIELTDPAIHIVPLRQLLLDNMARIIGGKTT